ncbi:molybdopterin-binding protein [Aureivirga sp. CE67]|uniref:TOBE domain-containing protein n=1 Tax=Aureivirga sp. CE67 TaxID=1788983 RepID=UPI0018C9500E|nr:TOBE domain-containing protein [Aureivirga sp. CE67]
MNSFQGEIVGLNSDGGLSLLDVQIHSVLFNILLIDNPETSEFLTLNRKIICMWKETEVILSKEKPNTSIENILKCTIENIAEDKILSKITLLSEIGNINAIITTKSLKAMTISRKDEVFAMINPNEIMISYD